ncbi:MAG: hypothetical protein H6828_13800 [Planctomycetes bacterium]|nr:hypothetical protein [Planctomycetota bacterium]
MLHACLLPLLVAPAGAAAGDWTVLPLPSLCAESEAAGVPALDDGSHLVLSPSRSRRDWAENAPLVPSDVLDLLRRLGRSTGVDVELGPYAPPLLARGDADQMEWVRAELAGLAAAGARRELAYRAWLVPGRLAADELRARLAPDAALPETWTQWSGTAPSGLSVAFGRRTQRAFLADYEVNVATDSGVADPVVGTLLTGTTLHLEGARVDGGRRVHVRGLLDLAQPGELERFDPHSPDLGQLDQPHVRALTLRFSGVVAPGELLTVEIAGAPLDQPEWTLFVGAVGAPEADADAEHGWALVSHDLLSREGPRLEPFAPGAGLGGQAALPSLRPADEPTSAGALAGTADLGAQGSGAQGARAGRVLPLLHRAEHFTLFAATPESREARAGLERIVAALEAPRLRTETITLTHGALRLRFPVASGEPTRVLVGSERPLLVDYHTEIAPNTWMPAPVVERCFDGLAWQGRRDARGFHAQAFESRTLEVVRRDRQEAGLGAMQLPTREVHEGAATLTSGDTARLWDPGAAGDALTVSVEAR